MKLKITLMLFLSLVLNLYSNDMQKEVGVGIKIGKVIFLDKYPKERLNWDEASKYCKNLNGRLPTIKELKLAYKSVGKNSNYFGGKRFWSSNERSQSDDKAYYFYFEVDNFKWKSKNSTNYVRCVKQRSNF